MNEMAQVCCEIVQRGGGGGPGNPGLQTKTLNPKRLKLKPKTLNPKTDKLLQQCIVRQTSEQDDAELQCPRPGPRHGLGFRV